MISSNTENPAGARALQPFARSDVAMLLYVAAATIVVHLLLGSRYGFQRDELATLEDARHLAWGYVAYPPITPFFARISLNLFGTSITGFRVFAFLAEATAVVLTGLMARLLGGRRGAQLAAAAAAIPFCLAGGALMQYVSFDYLFWVLTAFFVLCLLKSGDPRWWMAIGAAIGLGFMAKYSMAFLVVGIILGLAFTDARRYLASKWFWYGAAVGLLIFLPNIAWEAQHHFVSLEFLRHIHARDIRNGRTTYFLPQQLELTLFAFPLFLAGLWFYFSSAGRRFRTLGWMYVLPLLLFVVAKGRVYYLAGAYPMLYAGGCVWGERWLAGMRPGRAKAVRVLAWTALAADIILFAAILLPMAPINSRWWQIAAAIQDDYHEEIGWQELAQTVAQIRDSLPAADRAHMGILAGNYGEAGAVNLYGPQYGLPPAIAGTNSFWYKGYGDPPPQTLIVLGFDRDSADENFSACRLAGHTWNRYGVMNEETRDHPDIFVCGAPRKGWPDFWKGFQRFG